MKLKFRKKVLQNLIDFRQYIIISQILGKHRYTAHVFRQTFHEMSPELPETLDKLIVGSHCAFC